MIIPMGTNNLNYIDSVTNQQVLTNQQRNLQSHENPQRRVEGLSFSLYIGRLSKEFNDEFVQQILNYCGGVKKWKRAKGTFGFAEFTYAEGTLRAYQVLNGLRIKDKKIIVSIESENLKKLKQFETDLKQGLEPLRPATAPTQGTLSIEEQLEKRNKEALEKINALIKDRGFEPSKASASKSRSPSNNRVHRDFPAFLKMKVLKFFYFSFFSLNLHLFRFEWLRYTHKVRREMDSPTSFSNFRYPKERA